MENVKASLIGYLQERREETNQTLTVDKSDAAKALFGLHGLAMVVILLQELGVPIPLQVSAPVVFLALTFVPGGLAVLLFYDNIRLRAKHLLYGFGVSLMSLMAIGFVLNIILPLVGYLTPMSRAPLAIAVTLFNVFLAVLIFRRKKRERSLVRKPETVSVPVVPIISPVPLSFLLLPLLSILGVELLNRTGNNIIVLLILSIIALVPLVVVTTRVSAKWHTIGVWTVALAVLYHKSLWKYSEYRGQAYAIRIWEARRWDPGIFTSGPLSAELLPNGILYPLYARLTGVNIITQYNVINPVFVSFIPIALFVTFRRYTDSYKALLGASLFIFAHPFFRQYPTAGRAATPVVFLALFGVAISDQDSRRIITSVLSLLFLLGVVVSHYGTSYFIMATLMGALAVLAILRWVDSLIAKADVRKLSIAEVRTLVRRNETRVTSSLVLFYTVCTLTWYMYMRGGRKFDLLPKHAKQSYLQLVGGSTFSGRTAARIQRNYGTEAIQYSKYLYLVLGLLMAFGILVVLSRRLSNEGIDFDDHYFAIAVSILGIFGTTILVRNWGGGRPMMITYVFTTIFAVVGATAVEAYAVGRERRTIRLFAVLLAVLFILNSGVASALLLGGFAPSNVPNQENLVETPDPRAQIIVNKQTDLVSHVWLVDHHERLEVYGDTFANRQKDWYNPEINARIEGTSPPYGPTGKVEGKPLELPTLAQPGVESGYVLLLGHNLALDGVWREQYAPPAASLDELELSDRDKVFDTGKSEIYYYNEMAINDPPQVGTVENKSLVENETLTVTVNASDSENDPIELAVVNLPAFATFTDNNDGTGDLTLEPEGGDAGTYELTVTADDGEFTDTENVTVTVTENASVRYEVTVNAAHLTTVDDNMKWGVDTEVSLSLYSNSYPNQSILVNELASSTSQTTVDTENDRITNSQLRTENRCRLS